MNFLKENEDKVHHFTYSFAICMAICSLFAFLNMAPVIGFFGTLGIGIYKEVKDLHDPKGHAEFKDLVADMLGIVLAIGMFMFARMF